MTQPTGIILCLAYIVGLLSTSATWGVYVAMAVAIVAAIAIPRFWRTGPKPKVWLIAAVVAGLATVYFQLRLPQPATNDISKFIKSGSSGEQEQIVVVRGKVATTSRLTRSQRGQFLMEATQLDEVNGQDKPASVSQVVTGKLYVTVSLLRATGLYPGQEIAVTGVLYKPMTTANPGGFDFSRFLRQEGIFAGLRGRQINFPDSEKKLPRFGWWAVKARIVRSQVRWLGSPAGPLVSSLVLGSKAVDLPYDIRDLFVRNGLAHTLAASGFQTALILSVVLTLTRRSPVATQIGCGAGALLIFLCLAGFQSPILRAVIMGFGALVGLATKRKVKPLGMLLLAAALLLLYNPLWIWDLGFQLSFLSTLGLLVTVPPLVKRLDRLPPTLSALIATPIAACIWTLPIQIYYFGTVPIYSFVLNILTTPLVSLISIGGIISAIAALVWPLAGSVLAWLLYYPTQALIGLVQLFSQLPVNSVAVGKISVIQLFAIYSVFSLAWLFPWWQRRWWIPGLLAVALVLIPAWQTQATMFRITVLSTASEPVMVVQDHGKVVLVNSGNASSARFTVLPFLQQQGINRIDLAIATQYQSNTDSGWLQILQNFAVKSFYFQTNTPNAPLNSLVHNAVKSGSGSYQRLSSGQTVAVGSTSIQLIDSVAPILQLKIKDQAWLLAGYLQLNQQNELAKSERLPRSQVLWWTGYPLDKSLLKSLKPEVAIASSVSLDRQVLADLRKSQLSVFWTGKDGAIQWTPNSKFEATIEASEDKNSLI